GFHRRRNVRWFSPGFKRFRAARGAGTGRRPRRRRGRGGGRRFVFRGRLRTRVGQVRNRSRRCRSFRVTGSSSTRRRSGRRRRRRGRRRRFVVRGKLGTRGHARNGSRRPLRQGRAPFHARQGLVLRQRVRGYV